MKKLVTILGLSVALFMGMASATVKLDDSNFNYFDAEDGYTSLSYENGQLTLIVTDEMTNENLKVSGSDMLPLDIDNADNFNDRLLQSFIPASEETAGVSVAHEDTRLNTIVSAYTELFEAEGFSGSVEQINANGEVLIFESANTMARVIFTQEGEDVTVFFTVL